LNGDLLWQSGEEGRLVSEQGGTANALIDPNWKLSRTHDIALWVERELIPNFGIRTGFVHRRNLNVRFTVNPNRPLSAYNIQRTAQDPGADGVAGNADDGGLLTVYDLDPAALAAPILTLTTHDNLVGGEKYSTFEFSGTKRMTNHWSLNASFVENWIATATQPTGITGGTVPSNPNQFLGSESDKLFHYTTSQAKVTTIFEIPFDINLSTVMRFQAGQPWGRKISLRLNYGLETIQVEPTSAQRTDNIALADFRVEKGMKFGQTKLAVFLDVFNLFNGNPSLNVVQTSSSNYLRPLDIVAPRIARIGTKFEW
jgi:hypothetical protein